MIDIKGLSPVVVNKTPFDKFTAAHFVFGFAMAKLKFQPYQDVFSAVSFELIEDLLKKQHPDFFPNPTIDSKENSLIDVLATLSGFGLGRKI